MRIEMKQRYRVFRRGWGTCYVEDFDTKKQESLHTREKAEACRLVAARNLTDTSPAFSLQLARVYWKAGDSAAATLDWEFVMGELVITKNGDTRYRWDTAIKDRAFAPLRRRWASATGFCLPPKFGSRSVLSSGSLL
jgi:hypothetical protein